MTPTVEQLCEMMTGLQLLSSADLSRLRARWFQPGRADAANLDRFGQWLTVNGYLSGFAFRMLRDGKGELLRLNQYQLADHLSSGPFAGAYLALDPVRRPVVLEVLSADWAARPEGVRAFRLAAERAMTVRHPNVGLTLDFGEAHGRHYLVREFDEGDTLADILARRGKLQPIPAARLFAVALLGLQALHEKQVSTGPLDAECFLLTAAGKSTASKARTVKILHAGVPRSLFDPSALDDTGMSSAGRDPLSGDVEVPSPPRDDLFRLGSVFYRSLTGQSPFAADAPAGAALRAVPLRQLAPDVPDMLASFVESLIDPDPAQRPSTAARAAKSLRVLLAHEEESRNVQPEEHLAHLRPAPAPIAAAEETDADKGEAAAEAAEPRGGEGPLSPQLKAAWQELRPDSATGRF